MRLRGVSVWTELIRLNLWWKPEENLLLCQILSKMEFLTWHLTFLAFPKDWINQSYEYEAISGIQNITHKGLSEQSSFTFHSYKIFVKRFHFYVSQRYLGLLFLMKETKMKNVMFSAPWKPWTKSVYFSPQNNTCIISLPNTSKAVRAVQSLSTIAWFCLKEIISTFLPSAILLIKTFHCMSRLLVSWSPTMGLRNRRAES